MAYKLTIIQNPSYIHVIVTGKNSKQNVTQYLKDVLLECTTRKYRKVLIEEHLEGPRLNTFPIFEIAKNGSEEARGYFEAIAYVDVNAVGGLMQFAETVAVNRGIPVTVFASVADAKIWLNNMTMEKQNKALEGESTT